MRRFLLALQFLTILKIKAKPEIIEKDFGISLAYFPIIGLFIGLVLILIFNIFGFLPHLVKIALILIVYVIITGALHLDGFTDTCDGLYAGRSKEEILAIMRDPHTGAMGVIGLICLLLFKFVVLFSLPEKILIKTLIAMVVFGRWSQVFSCYISKDMLQEGTAKYFVEYVNTKIISFATLFTLGLFLMLLKIKGLMSFLICGFVVFLFINFIKKKIGGLTGDTIGATNEVAEIGYVFISLFLFS